MQKHEKINVKLHPNGRTFTQEPTDMDLDRRQDACARMIEVAQFQNVGKSPLVMNVTYTEAVDQ